jgi:hypothetical protein
MTRIGEVLVERGLVPAAQIRRALDYQRSARCGLKLGSILLGFGAISERGLLKVLTDLHGVPAVPWSSLSAVAPDVARMLPAEHAFRLDAVPYAAYREIIGVAFASPSRAAVAEVCGLTGRRVLAAISPEVRILQAHSLFYGRRMDAARVSRAARADDAAQTIESEPGDSTSSQWLSEFAAEALDEFERKSGAVLRQAAVPATPEKPGAGTMPRRKAGFTTEDLLRELLGR